VGANDALAEVNSIHIRPEVSVRWKTKGAGGSGYVRLEERPSALRLKHLYATGPGSPSLGPPDPTLPISLQETPQQPSWARKWTRRLRRARILQTRRVRHAEDPVNESSAALSLLLFGLNLLLLLLDYGPSLFGCRPRRGIVALCHPLPVLRKPQ
jgi:hypothetical protein